MRVEKNNKLYDECKIKVESGLVDEALNDLESLLSSDKCLKEYYELVSLALLKTFKKDYLHSQSAYSNIDNIYFKLIQQNNCDSDGNIFLKTITAYQSTNEDWVFPAVARNFEPLLSRLYKEGILEKNSVLYLIILRNFINFIPQDEISAIHLNFFHEFDKSDLSLAYHNIFTASSVYQKNIQDLSELVKDRSLNDNSLKLIHIILIVWIYGDDNKYPYEISELLEIIRKRIINSNGDDLEINNSIAKALIIRHIDKLIKIDGRIDELLINIDESNRFSNLLIEINKNKNQIQKVLNNKSPKKIDKRFNSKLYNGSMACKNIIYSHININLSRKKYKVAVCISGQLRGYKQTFESWKRSILKDIDYDIFINSWYDIGRSGAEPIRKKLPFDGFNFKKGYREYNLELGFEEMKSNYPILFRNLKQSAFVNEDEIKSFYQAKEVVLDDDKDNKYIEYSNSEKMHYKIKACNDMYKKYNEEYDLVIRIRPDLPIKYIGFNWNDLYSYCYSKPVIFSDLESGVHYMNFLIGDQFAVGNPDVMDIYSNAWNLYPKLRQNNVFGSYDSFLGHISLGSICWTNGIMVKKIPIKRGHLNDTKNMSVEEIYASIKADSDGRNSFWDMKFIELLEKDFIEKKNKK